MLVLASMISRLPLRKEVEHLDFNFAHLSSDRSTEVQKDMFSLAFGENIANNFPKFMRKFHGSKSPLRVVAPCRLCAAKVVS